MRELVGKRDSMTMKRKILLINPISLFPTIAMNQVRTLHMIKSLSRFFDIDVLTPVVSIEESSLSRQKFSDLGINFSELKSKKHRSNIIRKRWRQVVERIHYYALGTDKGFVAGKSFEKEILTFIKKSRYDYIISNYWEISDFFRQINDCGIKILDTHYAVKENIEVLAGKGYYNSSSFFKNRELKNSLKSETEIIQASDIILSLSSKCYSIFLKDHPLKKHILIPDGNDINYYSPAFGEPEPDTILFYGSMQSLQNIGAFKRLYHEILPLIKIHVPDVRLLVVGNAPPPEILNLHNGKNIVVTGFVEDVRPWLAKGSLLILPLEIGSGFRGRIVEVMAMGIPVAGTHNALDSLDMVSGEQGLISDSDTEIADFSIRLLKDKELRKIFSLACRHFAVEKYSIESTFDKFTRYLTNREFKD